MIICPKCKSEYEPCGNHDEDSGKRECEVCGFKFIVRIDYEPEYLMTCVEHEFSEFIDVPNASGGIAARFCKHCQKCEIQ